MSSAKAVTERKSAVSGARRSPPETLHAAFVANFLGDSPGWYKAAVTGFLVANPVLATLLGPHVTAWVLTAEFIFCLAMAFRCYPLQPGRLLVIEAVAIGLTSPAAVYDHTLQNLPVILLLAFMVAGIHFMRELLIVTFTRILLRVESKTTLSFVFCATGALLSAFLDALTVIATVLTVAGGVYMVYHRAVSARSRPVSFDGTEDMEIVPAYRADLRQFRAFLRGLLMHAAAGSALGGVATLVGEPQNLVIGAAVDWSFLEFARRVAPVSVPVLVVGLLTCWIVERFRLFGYGAQLPENVRVVLDEERRRVAANRTVADSAVLRVQAGGVLFALAGLAFHLAEVGLIGLGLMVLITAFNGITDERRIGHAFEAALSFTALLVVFFGVVAIIHEQALFVPLVDWALTLEGRGRDAAFFLAAGALSAISDNVFVASVYLTEVLDAYGKGAIDRVEL